MTKVTMPEPVAWATPDLSKLFGENEMRTLEGLGGSREKQKTVFSVALITTTQAEAYKDACVREALEAAIHVIPNEPFAIVADRIYEGQGVELAIWNGVNYEFADGDCYEREGDTLDGYTASWLTQYRLEQLLNDEAVRPFIP